MEEENKKLFDSISESEFVEEMPEQVIASTSDRPKYPANTMVEAPEEEEIVLGELSEGVKKEVILKEEDLQVEKDKDGKEKKFLIAEIELAVLGKPQLKDADGNPIQPKAFSENDPTKKGYTTKLKIEYKGNNYISLLPNVKWYLGTNKEGKKVLNPWFRTAGLTQDDLDDSFTSVVSKLYYKYCKFVGEEVGKVSQADFVKGLVGKKVKLVQWSDIFKKEKVYRIDIEEFVK